MREVTLTSHVSDQARSGGTSESSFPLFVIFAVSVLIILMGGSMHREALVGIGGLGVVIAALVAISRATATVHKRAVYGYGEEGERFLQQALRSILDDRYIAFWGFPRSRGGDVDAVVVGPSGVFAIEAKHHNGDIQYTEGGWRQVKTGRGGTAYFGDNFGNPGAQTMGGVHDLKAFLEQKNIKTFIHGVLVFTNPEANLYIEKDTKALSVCHIVDLESLFASDGGRPLPSKKQEVIEHILLSLSPMQPLRQ
jgi:hypothetical protein